MQTLIVGSLQLGLLYSIMALGVYISFRVLNTPDLTVDGSFTLGMAVSAAVCASGRPWLSLAAAAIAGAAAGLVTGGLQTRVGIHPILSGILTMIGLYSVNMFVMGGKSNVSLVGAETIFTSAQLAFGLTENTVRNTVCIIAAAIAIGVLSVFFKTRSGMAIRATGDNEEMVRSSSINADASKRLGFSIGNALVALSGGLICHYQMFSDLGYGRGMVVMGLASVIIGETIFGRRGITFGLICATAGSVIYRLMIAAALKVELFPAYGLNLVSALIVGFALSVPALKEFASVLRAKRTLRNKYGRGGA